jgi:NAD(P)-dependent dehydrogenase (short-subunit alcohol dehydrogenase family)
VWNREWRRTVLFSAVAEERKQGAARDRDTGASSGIGLATAYGFAERGDTVPRRGSQNRIHHRGGRRMAERKDEPLPQQQDKAEGEREEENRGLSDAPAAPLQMDQAEGEPEDVDEDVSKAEKQRKRT